MIWILPLIGLIGFELIADVFAKEYALKGGQLWLVALIFYIIGNSFWLYSIRHGSGLARGADIFAVSTAVLATFIGVYFFHEELKYIQLLGLGLGIISLVLIFWR